jgi:hypothetical protein
MTLNKRSFRVYFNKRRQWCDVFIADNSRKFMFAEKCYAYYQPTRDRKARRGLFGEVHFSRVGSGLVAHELLHLLIDWIKARGSKITDSNEERIVLMYGELVRNFWRRYYQIEKKTDV